MSAAGRTRHTRRSAKPARYFFAFKRATPQKVLAEISNKYKAYIDAAPGSDDELVEITDTDWYLEMEKDMTPGKVLKTLREVKNLTQTQLGELTATPASRISDYETGQRSISKQAAKRIAKALDVSPAVFI